MLELATGRVAGYEALARMPDGPFRPPDQWFNQAHRVGLGAALEAPRCAPRSRPRPSGADVPRAQRLTGRAISHEVRAVLPQDLTGIVIELTEHELFSADLALDREIDALRARGARIALDDAGNGYAGLQQIIRIAPDILKLDRSLVDGIHDDPHRFALLEALISFASTTRAAVCAEGVETIEDLDVLSGMDVTYAQGWALARPEAPWAALAPHAAAAATAEVQIGLRVRASRPRTARRRWATSSRGSPAWAHTDDLAECAAMIPAVLGAEDAAVSRVVPGEHCVEDISRHGWSQPGARYHLDEYPATAWVLRTRTAGQVVVGDPASDPAEVDLIERNGFGAVLMVPLVFGGRDVGLLELYRRHALPWSSAEIERAQLLAHQLAAVVDLLERVSPAARLSRSPHSGSRWRSWSTSCASTRARAAVPLVVPHGDGRRLDELHAFAARLGLRRAWFQGDHYDLPPHGRAAAVALGAEEVGTAELLLRMAGPRGDRARRRSLAPAGRRLAARRGGAGGPALPAGGARRDRRAAGGGEVDARGPRRGRPRARPRSRRGPGARGRRLGRRAAALAGGAGGGARRRGRARWRSRPRCARGIASR